MTPIPGGEISNRPLHFIWIVDCSGSMAADGKMQQLNTAIKESLPEMKKAADENFNAKVYVRAVKFSSGAQWHFSQLTEVKDFNWTDLTADGVTDMGKALSLVAEELDVSKMGERALPPVLVLMSDGQPTDDYAIGLKELFSKPWGKKAVKIAIAIGSDADTEVLQKFINNPELQPLEAKNAEQLVKYIRWCTTEVITQVAKPPSQPKGTPTPSSNVILPELPSTDGMTGADVW